MVILQSYFPSYNYQQDKCTYYDCWITPQTALKIAAYSTILKHEFIGFMNITIVDKISLLGKNSY